MCTVFILFRAINIVTPVPLLSAGF